MTKHTIEIEGLPEGWEAVAFRVPDQSEYYFGRHGLDQATDEWPDRPAAIILQKIKPHRIVLEETEQDNIKHDGKWCNQHFRDGLILTQQPKYWRIKEE